MSKPKARGLSTVNLDRYTEALEAQPKPIKPLSPVLPVTDITLADLEPAPWNARRYFDEKQLRILGKDMLDNGQIHAITVRQLNGRFEVVVGERRMRAASLVGMSSLRAYVRPLDDREARRIGLSENLQRENLSPFEETVGWLDFLALELESMPAFGAFTALGEANFYAAARVLRRFHKESQQARKQGLQVDHNVMVHGDKEADHNVMVRSDRLVFGTALGNVIESLFTESATMTWESFVKNRLPILSLPSDLLDVMNRGELEYTKATELNKIKDPTRRTELLGRVLQLGLPLTQIRQLVATSSQRPSNTGDRLKTLAQTTMRRFADRLEHLTPEQRRRAETLLIEIEQLVK